MYNELRYFTVHIFQMLHDILFDKWQKQKWLATDLQALQSSWLGHIHITQ